jgi:hypothetical protein
VVSRQIPKGVRRNIRFRVREWEGVPWVVAYVFEWRPEKSCALERILVSGDLEEGRRKYGGCIILRSKISDEFLATLALLS